MLADGLRQRRPCRLVLAKYQGADPDLVRVEARLVEIKGEARLSFVHRYRTRDVTTNLAAPQALIERARAAAVMPGTSARRSEVVFTPVS